MVKFIYSAILLCALVSQQCLAKPMPNSLKFKLDICANQNDLEEIMDIISDDDFDLIDSQDEGGRSPLYIAAETGNIALVNWLIHVQSPIMDNNYGMSPTDIASKNLHMDCVGALTGYLPLDVIPAAEKGQENAIPKELKSPVNGRVKRLKEYVEKTYVFWEDDHIARQRQYSATHMKKIAARTDEK